MKRVIAAMATTCLMMSCNDSANNTNSNTEEQTNPSAIDTTQHPNGMTNGSVISTDTASMNVDNVNPEGRDSANKQ